MTPDLSRAKSSRPTTSLRTARNATASCLLVLALASLGGCHTTGTDTPASAAPLDDTFAQRKVELAQELVEDREQRLASVRVLADAGRVAPAELARAAIDLGAAQVREAAYRHELATTRGEPGRAELERWLAAARSLVQHHSELVTSLALQVESGRAHEHSQAVATAREHLLDARLQVIDLEQRHARLE